MDSANVESGGDVVISRQPRAFLTAAFSLHTTTCMQFCWEEGKGREGKGGGSKKASKHTMLKEFVILLTFAGN